MEFYLYLHGFASSPQSTKARSLSEQFQSLNLSLVIPDLNQNDFTHLTLTRQIQQTQALLPPAPTPVTLIGSSFGGLTAAWLGEQCPQIQRLVLLAPAFGFLSHWLPKLGAEQLQHWRQTRSLLTYHYGEQRQLPLDYGFLTDLERYSDSQIQRPIPTLILHGLNDDVIPIAASRAFAAARPWVQLVELGSDHTLGDVQAEIWQHLQSFCQLPIKSSRL